MDPIANFQATAELVAGLIDGCSDEQLAAQSPCAKWTARDVANHMVGGAHMFAGSARGQDMSPPGGEMPDMLGDDPAGAYRAAAADVVAAYSEEGMLEAMVKLPFAEMPGAAVLGVGMADHLAHAWDFAQATGQSVSPSEELAQAAKATWEMALRPELRDGDAFAEQQDAPEGASTFEQMLAFTSRKV